MKWIVRSVIGVVVLAVVVVAGAAVMLTTMDPNAYKERISSLVKEKSGRDLSLAGNIKVMYYPVLGFDVADVHLGNPPGFPKKDFLSVGQAQVGVKIVPLFQNKIELTTIRLINPQISVIKKADGQTNLDFKSKTESREATKSSLSAGRPIEFSAGKIEISDANVSYLDEQDGKTTRIESLNLTLPAFSAGRPEDISLDMAIKMGVPPSTTLLKMTGRVTASPDTGNYNIAELKSDITVSSSSPEETKISLSGDAAVDTRSEKITLTDLKAAGKGTEVKGRASIEGFSKPEITFDISSTSIDVDALVPTNISKTDSGAGGKNGGNDNQELLPVELLRKLALSGNIAIATLKASGLTLNDVKLRVSGRDGVVAVDPVNVNLYKGSLTSQIKVDARSTPPALSITGALKDAEISGLLKDMAGEDYVAGLTNVTFSLSSRGNTVRALEDSAGGNLKFGLSKGYINKWQLSKRMNQAIGFFQTGSIQANASDKIYFTSLDGTITGENGVFHNNDLQFIGPKTHALGDGSVSLRNQTVDYSVQVGMGDDPRSFKTARHLPIRITGPLSAPNYSLDVQSMVSAVAGQRIESAKQQLIGKALGKQEPAAGTTDKGSSGGKQNLLKGLFGH